MKGGWNGPRERVADAVLKGVLASDYIVESMRAICPYEEAGGRRGKMFGMGRGHPTLDGSCRVLRRDSKKLLSRNKLRLAE